MSKNFIARNLETGKKHTVSVLEGFGAAGNKAYFIYWNGAQFSQPFETEAEAIGSLGLLAEYYRVTPALVK